MPRRLTDLQIRNEEPRAKKFKLSAGGGLCLLVMPDGAKYWRLRYRFGGRQKELSVGQPYPNTSLREAEIEASKLREQLLEGIDPAEVRLSSRLAKGVSAETFGQVAEDWHRFRSKAWAPNTALQVREYLDKDILPKLGRRPLNNITAPELAQLVSGIEDRGAFDIAAKTRQWLNQIYAHARAKGWTEKDPARDLAAIAEKGPGAKNYPHLKLDELPAFLQKLDAYKGSKLVRGCAWLAFWTANRPGVTRTLRWAELDFKKAVWSIEKGRRGMKLGYRHETPLPTQAIEMLQELKPITGSFEYVLPRVEN